MMMHTTVTLISPESIPDVNSILGHFKKLGISVDNQKWLSRHKAVEWHCSSPLADLRALLNAEMGGQFLDQKIDWIVQPAGDRRKRMLITDMDSTIIQCECIDEIADIAGLRDRVAKITEAAMNGEIDFATALRERVALLQGLPVEKLQGVLDERVHLTPGAMELVSTMRDHGAVCVLVSGGFTFFTAFIARRCRFHFHHACQLGVHDNVLTGETLGEIVDKEAKLRYMDFHAGESGLTREDICAVGDGANDVPMLEAAGLSIAFHAKEKVDRVIENRIRFNDLRAVLYCQGYADEEMA
jgi:phosphoserine phosphatase